MITVQPINPVSHTAWQITPTSATDLVLALSVLAPAGYTGIVTCWSPQEGVTSWQLQLNKPGYPQQNATIGDWIIFDGTFATVFTPAEAAENYTVNTALVWTATATAPVSTALPGSKATIVFGQPASLNGPFEYTVEQTDATSQSSTPATPQGLPAVDADGNVTLTVIDLPIGDELSFAVTVTTPYTGVTATSLPSNQITATT